jgi:hypothetical protein
LEGIIIYEINEKNKKMRQRRINYLNRKLKISQENKKNTTKRIHEYCSKLFDDL